MTSWVDTLEIEARASPGILLEGYRYAPGPPSDYPPHVHETYQIGIALDRGGEYRFRGATRPVPTHGLVIIHPGERHSVRETEYRHAPARYLMLYAAVDVVQAAATEAMGRAVAAPFFGAPAFDTDLVRTYISLHSRPDEGELARESRLVMLFAGLTERHGDEERRPPSLRPTPRALSRARDYIHAHATSAVSLSELADVAGLSRYYLVRQFARAYGAPPHAYQLHLRIDSARRLLASGVSAPRVALQTGFFDQSHFGRHFRRIVGTTPGRYRANAQAQ